MLWFNQIQVLQPHGFHGARGWADVARMAGLAKHNPNIVKYRNVIKNELRQFGEAPNNAKMPF